MSVKIILFCNFFRAVPLFLLTLNILFLPVLITKKILFLLNLKRKLQQAYSEHEMAAKLNLALDKFNKDWNLWSPSGVHYSMTLSENFIRAPVLHCNPTSIYIYTTC